MPVLRESLMQVFAFEVSHLSGERSLYDIRFGSAEGEWDNEMEKKECFQQLKV